MGVPCSRRSRILGLCCTAAACWICWILGVHMVDRRAGPDGLEAFLLFVRIGKHDVEEPRQLQTYCMYMQTERPKRYNGYNTTPMWCLLPAPSVRSSSVFPLLGSGWHGWALVAPGGFVGAGHSWCCTVQDCHRRSGRGGAQEGRKLGSQARHFSGRVASVGRDEWPE